MAASATRGESSPSKKIGGFLFGDFLRSQIIKKSVFEKIFKYRKHALLMFCHPPPRTPTKKKKKKKKKSP